MPMLVSLDIFHMGTLSTLLLPTVKSLYELRLLAGDGLDATHYLPGCKKHFIAQDGKSPGRLVEPGAKRHDKKSSILGGIILIIQITKRAVPELVSGAQSLGTLIQRIAWYILHQL